LNGKTPYEDVERRIIEYKRITYGKILTPLSHMLWTSILTGQNTNSMLKSISMDTLITTYKCRKVKKLLIENMPQEFSAEVKETLPLIFGGTAKYCMGLRKFINDIDIMLPRKIFELLYQKVPKADRLYQAGERGMKINRLEIWESIFKRDYNFWIHDSVKYDNLLIISPFLQLLMSILATSVLKPQKKEKQKKDAQLLLKKIYHKTYTANELKHLL